jgi:murein DD-endopeptidase MepM/ murein hydrolase activator NlpD
MKDHLSITVSHSLGSRYYSLPGSAWKWAIGSAVTVGLMFAVSVVVMGHQWGQINRLADQLQVMDQEILRFDSENSQLSNRLATHLERENSIVDALMEVERTSSMDPGDEAFSLQDRIRMLAGHYRNRDAGSPETDNGVTPFKDWVGAQITNPVNGDASALIPAVDLTGLTASHEKILYDSIPSGFPTPGERITSDYGSRILPQSGVRSFHKGVDLGVEPGDVVHAAADGIVRSVKDSRLSGARVVVQHNFGFESRYSPLFDLEVLPGDIVHKGDILGIATSSGGADEANIHYEIRYLGQAINPLQFLQWEFGSHEIFTTVRGIKWPSLISLINKQITHQTLQLSQLGPISSVK